VLHAPPIALGRAITNLLENALRYAPGKPIELHVKMDSSKVRIGVLDNGLGVPESQLSLILEPFQRLETSRSPLTGGSGLGLSIVSELCKANTWAFEVSNRPNGGLQAWITLAA
jgi:two-component system osmolarity sensor histidine kinase EnvZ